MAEVKRSECRAYPLQQKRDRYGELGDVESWPSVDVWLVEFLRPVGLSISVKRCPYSLLGPFPGIS